MSEQVVVIIDGKAFSGWKRVELQRSLMAMAGSFNITLADELTGMDWQFATQKECVIKFGADKVMTGIVEVVEITLNSNSHDVVISGRDKTGDLVDCSVVANNNADPFAGTLKDVDVLSIAKSLLNPFDISVKSAVSVGEKFRRFAVQRGETVFEALDRACKQRGFILSTDENGTLLITASGQNKADDVLKYGSNIKSARAIYDYSNRYSHYRVEAQAASAGDTSLWNASTNVFGVKRDDGVTRLRPMYISAEADPTSGSCEKRATFEALYRAANSISFEVEVQGWRQSRGQLWQINQLVDCDIPALYLKENLLVASCYYELSNDVGSKVTLNLMRNDAFNTARALESLALKDPKGTKRNW